MKIANALFAALLVSNCTLAARVTITVNNDIDLGTVIVANSIGSCRFTPIGNLGVGCRHIFSQFTLEDTENLLTGWEVDELTCEAILEESTLDTWIGVGATSFDKAINMVIRSGAVRPPKGQVRAFNDRVDTASKLYASGLAGYCYAGGTVT